jgi:hypothetical protein
LSCAGLTRAKNPESKCARISRCDQGTSATARGNQVSCLPAGVSGADLETNNDAGNAAAAPPPGPVLPGDPLHPAAAPAITTLGPAPRTRRAAIRPGRRLALPGGNPPVEVTRRLRSPRRQNEFISARPLTVGLVQPL